MSDARQLADEWDAARDAAGELTFVLERQGQVIDTLRLQADEIERLSKLVVHCDDCGADYAETGIEAGWPCRLREENERLRALITRLLPKHYRCKKR